MEADAQYLAGFLDGDGSVEMLRPSGKRIQPVPRVCASQSYTQGEPPELRLLKSRFSGSIHKREAASATSRCNWVFRSHASSREEMLSLMADHGIVKRTQAELALDYLVGCKEDPEYFIREIAREKAAVGSIDIDMERLTFPYLAGLFAAEGSVALDRKKTGTYNLISSITQTSCVRLLHAIKEKLGYGSVAGGRINFSVTATEKFLKSIRPFIKKSQKLRQVKVVERYLRRIPQGRGNWLSDEERKRVERYSKKLQRLKKR